MNKITHDPSECIRGLQQLLVSDKKKIAFLFGAGTSLAKKNKNSLSIPAIGKMTDLIEAELNENERIKSALEEIKLEIGEDKFNIETFLSNIEEKRHIIGKGVLNGLMKSDFTDLVVLVKNLIRDIVSIHRDILKDNALCNLIHVDFAEWLGRADRKHGIEIFTTNYDYLIELGLEEKSIPYYDGFSGSYKPFFNSESVDDLTYLPRQTKLWKLHGSLGWHIDIVDNKNIEKIWRKDSDSDDILIYPSTLKYADSKKQPYIALMDRLTNFLKQPDSVLIVCGYSFGDLHINERILTALKSSPSSHIYILYYDTMWNNGKKENYLLTESSVLSKFGKSSNRISVLGCRNAVIGCQYGKWRLKREPDKNDPIDIELYFDSDGHSDENEPIGIEKKGDEFWTGEGELKLTNFKDFVTFLESMILIDKSIGVNKNVKHAD